MSENTFIPFNRPFISGKELGNIQACIESGKLSGDGPFTKKCQNFFKERYKFDCSFMMTSCTDALELAALLLNIQEGDEVILPAYTFVSTANAFALRKAKLVFCDSLKDSPNIDVSQIEELITKKTKAVVVVHYAGIAVDMDALIELKKRHHFAIVEDAAQAIDSYYRSKPLGSFGDVSAFSFHETKNIVSGEGGLAVINNIEFRKRAEILREKGTNRSAFFRGEVDKYGWVDIGSSFLPSDLISAFLFAQLENLEMIQKRRQEIWQIYFDRLAQLKQDLFSMPLIPSYATNNAHAFYIVLNNLDLRQNLIGFLKQKNVQTAFHYLSLHHSTYFKPHHDGRHLPNSDKYTDCLLRLPLYGDLSSETTHRICDHIQEFISLQK